jgi:hypothetical protein
MINIGGNPLMILLALVAALGGVGLYFVRYFRPELARDHDIFFSAIALVYGIILLAFNFRMEITTQLAQVLVVGFSGWFVVETLTLRSSLSNQARRAPMDPIMDEPIGPPDYPEYRVEIDPTRELSPRRSPSSRQMRGADPAYDERPSELRGDIEGESNSRRTRRPRRASNPNPNPGRPGSSRRPSNPNSDSVIDIDEDDISPVAPKRRRPRSPAAGVDSRDRDRERDSRDSRDIRDRDRSRDLGMNNPPPTQPRRRRPSSRPPARNPNDYGIDEQDDW